MRVCVIGAGAAGLCAAYHLQAAGIDHVVFEQTGVPGGTWVYQDNGENVHSSMYRDLRTNLPVEIMGYPNFPFPSGTKSFAHHTVVKAYFDEFYKKNVQPHGNVRFYAKVIKVRRAPSAQWEVDVDINGIIRIERFSHIMVCNGKYSVPRIPVVSGLATFTGTVEHSHSYRIREKYAGKRVVVIGAGFSGIDISLEISTVAHECFISHRSPVPLNLPCVSEKGVISHVEGGRVYFGPDDSVDDVDCLMFCTGYRISVPFLDDYVTVDDGFRVRDLFRHSILISNPTITFIGLPSRIVPCVVFDYQVRYAIATFTGNLALPCVDEMRRELAEDKSQRDELDLGGLRYAHDLRGPLLWRYLQKFADDGLGPVDPLYRRGYEASHFARKKDLAGYRDKPLGL